MEFKFSDEMLALRDTVRKFVSETVMPHVATMEAEDRIPQQVLDAAKEIGLFGMSVPVEYGGLGLSTQERAVIHENLGRGPWGVASYFSVHTGIGSVALAKFGTAEQKKKYLPKIADGSLICAFALTEAEAGSDAGALRTSAVRDGNEWVINGTKTFITNGPVAGMYTLFARTNDKPGTAGVSTFIVERDRKGVSIGQTFDTIGHRGSQIGEIVFDNVRVPAENMIGKEGEGFKNAYASLNVGRTTLAARCVGSAQRALELATDYAQTRKTFGQALIEHQQIGFWLAEMNAEIDAARLLVYRSAWRIDQGLDAVRAASHAKFFAAEHAWKAIDRAVQIFGGVAYIKGETEIERLWRDVRVVRVYDGSSEIQQRVVQGLLQKGQLEYAEGL